MVQGSDPEHVTVTPLTGVLPDQLRQLSSRRAHRPTWSKQSLLKVLYPDDSRLKVKTNVSDGGMRCVRVDGRTISDRHPGKESSCATNMREGTSFSRQALWLLTSNSSKIAIFLEFWGLNCKFHWAHLWCVTLSQAGKAKMPSCFSLETLECHTAQNGKSWNKVWCTMPSRT